MKNNKNVNKFIFGNNTAADTATLVDEARGVDGRAVFYIDEYFSDKKLHETLGYREGDILRFVPTEEEPKTTGINALRDELVQQGVTEPCVIVAAGGGITLDTGKAIANLMTNDGNAEDYQGWDLVPNPGIYKIAVPTLSGTGAEASRTCVMTNAETGLKLGMNSDHTIYDQLVLDPELTRTVPRNQYFYTGMDTYLHCVESLRGGFRNAVGDAFSRESINLCREVFESEDMQSEESREKMMVASYLGGCAIAHSFVGLVHPFSAGLSVVLGMHHGIANCIAMKALSEFYPEEHAEFLRLAEKQRIDIPEGVCSGLDEATFQALHDSTVIHEKPLSNALGEGFRDILTPEKVRSIFEAM